VYALLPGRECGECSGEEKRIDRIKVDHLLQFRTGAGCREKFCDGDESLALHGIQHGVDRAQSGPLLKL
jgi:hypothetical protein